MVPASAFKSGVLDTTKHARLLADIQFYAERAGVDPAWLWTSASSQLDEEEIGYLKGVRRWALGDDKIVGLVYNGSNDATARMSSMVGALVRAFIDARLMTAMQVQEAVQSGDHPDATVLMIPNFIVSTDLGKYDQRRIGAMGDLLTWRAAKGLQTVIYVDYMTEAKKRLSDSVYSIIEYRMFKKDLL